MSPLLFLTGGVDPEARAQRHATVGPRTAAGGNGTVAKVKNFNLTHCARQWAAGVQVKRGVDVKRERKRLGKMVTGNQMAGRTASARSVMYPRNWCLGGVRVRQLLDTRSQ